MSVGATSAVGTVCLLVGPFFTFWLVLPLIATGWIAGLAAVVLAAASVRSVLPAHHRRLMATAVVATAGTLASGAFAAWTWWVWEHMEWT